MSTTVIAACTVLAPMVVAGGEGAFVVWVSAPEMDSSIVTRGGLVDVTFDVGIYNREPGRGCREVYATGMYDFPVCAYVVQWALSWDGKWLTRGSETITTNGHIHSWSEEYARETTVVSVREPIAVNTDPGTHELHVQANTVLGVPLSSAAGLVPVDRAYPCGLQDYAHAPLVGCDYEATGWEYAPVVQVRVEDGTFTPSLPN